MFCSDVPAVFLFSMGEEGSCSDVPSESLFLGAEGIVSRCPRDVPFSVGGGIVF